MCCSEWWAYEFITLLAGYLGVKAQATQIITFNFTSIMYAVAQGLQTSSCTLVGKHVGNGETRLARQIYYKIKTASVFIIATAFVTFMLIRESFFAAFTSDKEIR